MSNRSMPVHLLIKDPDLPRPSISLSPSNVAFLGNNITIRCWVNDLNKKIFIYLYQTDAYWMKLKQRSEESHAAVAMFTIFNVGWHDGGRYHCRIKPPSDFFISYSSSDVELLVVESYLEKPTIYLQPMEVVALGGKVTVHCRSKYQAETYYFQKPVNPAPPLFMVTDRATDNFLVISNASQEDSGRYRCSYSPSLDNLSYKYFLSEPSDPVELLIADPGLAKPKISVIPGRIAVLGSNITIRCRVKSPSKSCYLHKAGDKQKSQMAKPVGDMAKFSISSVSRSHGGIYTCSYRPPTDSFISSETSNILELLVTDPSISRPTISLIPTELIILGGNVAFYYQTQERAVGFYLQKSGEQMSRQLMEINETLAKLTISNIQVYPGPASS
ncbi:leukocyte immunoglobulin-like receptor subfamily A member 2 [Hemicordylus capensis]|uniref:leukocyte immunoglobulin-like receptor subfamily A member 2 n=1 Tax=Hemicordylus capensis TaxID=884348 RepID=UPI002303E29D|nr:leukocyte immunoglobulin-like receptor subfamily A member 2 [Hemicordylus capensis]